MMLALATLFAGGTLMVVCWLLGVRSLQNDEVGDFLDKYDVWTMAGMYIGIGMAAVSAGVMFALRLTE